MVTLDRVCCLLAGSTESAELELWSSECFLQVAVTSHQELASLKLISMIVGFGGGGVGVLHGGLEKAFNLL